LAPRPAKAPGLQKRERKYEKQENESERERAGTRQHQSRKQCAFPVPLIQKSINPLIHQCAAPPQLRLTSAISAQPSLKNFSPQPQTPLTLSEKFSLISACFSLFQLSPFLFRHHDLSNRSRNVQLLNPRIGVQVNPIAKSATSAVSFFCHEFRLFHASIFSCVSSFRGLATSARCRSVWPDSELFRAIPSYSEFKKERGTSRPSRPTHEPLAHPNHSPSRPSRPWREVSLSEISQFRAPINLRFLLVGLFAPAPVGVPVSRILTRSHRFSRFLTDSHEFSRVLSISHEFSLFLALSRYEILRRNHDGSAARSNRAGFGARLHQLPGQAGTATAFRVIPSYYELFRVQKPDRGTSRPAACPNAKGARLYTPDTPQSCACQKPTISL